MRRATTGKQKGASYAQRFAENLKRLRLRKKLTGKEAALAITQAGYRVSWRTAYDWESGQTTPPIEALPSISAAYGVAIRTLFPVS